MDYLDDIKPLGMKEKWIINIFAKQRFGPSNAFLASFDYLAVFTLKVISFKEEK